MTNEMNAYIAASDEFEKSQKFSDVYVTDHKAKDRKVISNSEEEDADLYAYN